ncbi:hypothetical protein F2Q69_00058902 [Brassica cretica]|uniref:Uncharacterized protein n=1 Tax=Brassica cretica TaxID=69181 RepID=A0A8S9RFR8_BRACR|nr:hypothetical protein F2Q69_00058902 [Brassica cretica]
MVSDNEEEEIAAENKFLLEALTKRMEKMMDEKLEVLRQDKQTHSSDNQREPRRNRRERQEHAGSQETGVSRSLSAASCVTNRSTNLDKLESLIRLCKDLSKSIQRSIIGGMMVSDNEEEEIAAENKFLLEALTKRMEKMMDEKLEVLRQEKQTHSSDIQREPRRNRRE